MKLLNQYFLKLEDFLFSNPAAKSTIWWFATAVYSLLVIKILLLWPNVYQFYDVAQQTIIVKLYNPINWFTKTLLFVDAPNLNLAIILSLCALTLALFYRSFITSCFAFVICLNYNTLVFSAINGSDYLLGFFCLMLVFLNHRKSPKFNRILIINAAWLLLKFNFCFLYFVNAYGKLIKNIWLNGDAIYQSWNLDYFANQHLIPSFFYNKAFCMLTGWSVIAFEFAFAFLIWFHTPKKALLITGVLFHLGIGLLLSLPDFALTMMIGYIPFMKPEWLERKKAAQPLEPL